MNDINKIKQTLKFLLLSLALLFFDFALQPAFAQEALYIKNGSGLKKRIVGDPLAHLPKNIEVLTLFGERPIFHPIIKRSLLCQKPLVMQWSSI